jgi:hypothetical protein
MTDKEIAKIARGFTKGLLGKADTTNKCFIVCNPLRAYLSYCGIKCELTEGEIHYQKCVWHHYWITLSDGKIIDPTADQFYKPEGGKLKNLYVKPKPGYYIKYTKELYNKRIDEAVKKFHLQTN